MTAITATYWISCHMILVMSSKPILLLIFGVPGFIILESTQPGNHTQFTSGADAKV